MEKTAEMSDNSEKRHLKCVTCLALLKMTLQCLLTRYQTGYGTSVRLSFFFQFKSWRVELKTDT